MANKTFYRIIIERHNPVDPRERYNPERMVIENERVFNSELTADEVIFLMKILVEMRTDRRTR